MSGAGNVQSVWKPDPQRLDHRARALLEATEFAANLPVALTSSYLVKGWLSRGDISVIFGPSNVGKTFLALDIAHHVTKGRAWGRRRVVPGRVLYIAAEGGGSFGNRVSALDDAEMMVTRAPVTLVGGLPDTGPLVEMIAHLAGVAGKPFDLIVVDTLSRVMGGADENTAPAIADLVANMDVLRRATGAHIMLIHHSGKDLARGARGHSSLRAAIDTEIVLSRDPATGVITALLDKQRDGPTGLKFAYTLRQVELGRDQDGDLVTTCAVAPCEPGEPDTGAPKGPAVVALARLDALMADAAPGASGVPLDAWRAACDAAGLTTSTNADSQRKAFNRARADLEEKGLVQVRDGLASRGAS